MTKDGFKIQYEFSFDNSKVDSGQDSVLSNKTKNPVQLVSGNSFVFNDNDYKTGSNLE